MSKVNEYESKNFQVLLSLFYQSIIASAIINFQRIIYRRVVALDLKGFGDSDKPTNRRSYRIETLLDELKQFILALGVKNCSLIGHDLGALLGWYMVALNEEFIHKFVAISSPHPNFYWQGFADDSVFNYK